MTYTKNMPPFSERYSLPVQVSENLQTVSWETVVQLSSEFQLKSDEKSSKVKKVIKELQLSRLLLMDKIRQSKGGAIEPKLLVDIVKLLQRCEEVAMQYDVDLKEFSQFLFLISEKLKKEKIAHYKGQAHMNLIAPIKEELAHLKYKSKSLMKGKISKEKIKKDKG